MIENMERPEKASQAGKHLSRDLKDTESAKQKKMSHAGEIASLSAYQGA